MYKRQDISLERAFSKDHDWLLKIDVTSTVRLESQGQAKVRFEKSPNIVRYSLREP